jgi:hypothetical protein
MKLPQGRPRRHGNKGQIDKPTESRKWFEAADKRFEIAVGLDTDDPLPWLTWGKALLARNPSNPLGLATTDPEPALEKFRAARGLDPDDMETTKYLAGTLGMYGLLYDLSARREPRGPRPSWLPGDVDVGVLGHAYLDESAALFVVMRARAPEDVSYFKAYTQVMLTLGRVSEFIAVCRGVMEAYPGSPAARTAHRYWRDAIRLAQGTNTHFHGSVPHVIAFPGASAGDGAPAMREHRQAPSTPPGPGKSDPMGGLPSLPAASPAACDAPAARRAALLV